LERPEVAKRTFGVGPAGQSWIFHPATSEALAQEEKTLPDDSLQFQELQHKIPWVA
jgi:hypothetical protein